MPHITICYLTICRSNPLICLHASLQAPPPLTLQRTSSGPSSTSRRYVVIGGSKIKEWDIEIGRRLEHNTLPWVDLCGVPDRVTGGQMEWGGLQ